MDTPTKVVGYTFFGIISCLIIGVIIESFFEKEERKYTKPYRQMTLSEKDAFLEDLKQSEIPYSNKLLDKAEEAVIRAFADHERDYPWGHDITLDQMRVRSVKKGEVIFKGWIHENNPGEKQGVYYVIMDIGPQKMEVKEAGVNN